MAFHQNLEADRIDGFNLFSAFVRVPLLVLNGILGNDGTSSSDNIDRDTLRNSGAEKSISSGNDSNGNLRAKGTDSSNELMQRRQPSNTSTMAHSGTSDSSESLTDTCNNNNSGIKRTKKMSWSDESGLPLVWESEESMSHHEHNISPYSSVTGSFTKPTKSAMRKSTSVRSESHGLSDQDRNTASTSRYIPNMNPRTAGNGLILPTRPYGRHSSVDNKMLGSNGSEMSPQWGWYINTTPPTPELYHSRSTSKSLLSSNAPPKHQLMKGDSTNNISSNSDGKSCQNQVFQNLQNSNKANPMAGWTSIPI